MIPYHNPAPAYWAHVRAQERAKPQPVPSLAEARHLAKTANLETLAKLDLRPTDEILAETSAGRPSVGITAEAAAALEAYPISAAALAEDADHETARLLLLSARSDRRKDLANVKRARMRAKAAAKEKIIADRRQAEEQHRCNARSWARWSMKGGRMPQGL